MTIEGSLFMAVFQAVPETPFGTALVRTGVRERRGLGQQSPLPVGQVGIVRQGSAVWRAAVVAAPSSDVKLVNSIQLRSAGVLPVMLRLFIALCTACVYLGTAMTTSATPHEPEISPLISFQSPAEAGEWRTVNDGVMGGRSAGRSDILEGQLVFTGVINTNGGGFSSVRRKMEPGALEGARAFVLSVKSDARAYRLIARTETRFQGRYVSYQAPIPRSPEGEWSNVRVAFGDFVPSVFGRIVPASGISPGEVVELGFIIADDVDGDFVLGIRSISIER